MICSKFNKNIALKVIRYTLLWESFSLARLRVFSYGVTKTSVISSG